MASSSFMKTPLNMEARTALKVRNKVKYEWAINNFSCFLGLHCNKTGKYELDSPDFSSNEDNNHWGMKLGFNGRNSKYSDWLSMTVLLKKGPKNGEVMKIGCEIGILTRDKEIYRPYEGCQFMRTTSAFETKEFCEHPELLRKKGELMPNDTLHITCILTVYDEIISKKLPTYKPKTSNQLLKDLRNYYRSKRDSDIEFVVDNQTLKAHKFILMSRSCVFSRMFETDMAEKRQNKVIIVDARPEIFDKMLEFIYTDTVKGELDERDARDLLNVAEKYQLQHLKEICGEFLYRHVTPNNALEIQLLADRHAMGELLEVIKEYIKNNKEQIIKAMGLDYFVENPQLLKIVYQ